MLKLCKYCSLEIEVKNGQQFGAHIVNCDLNPNKVSRLIKISDSHKKGKVALKLNCLKCDNEFNIFILESEYKRNDYKKHCSRKCSNSKIMSKQTKEKISNKLLGKPNHSKGKILVNDITRICESCNSEFKIKSYKKTRHCSIKCGSKGKGGYRPNSGSNGAWYYCKEMNKSVYLDSSWEISYASYLDTKQIKWTRPKPFIWIDAQHITHKYYPDFHILDDDKFIDIKNDYLISLDSTKDKITRVESQNKVKIYIMSKKDLDALIT